MEIFSILLLFVSMIHQRVVAERELVTVGNIQYQCGMDGRIFRIKSNTTILRLPRNRHAMYRVNTERASRCSNLQQCTLMSWRIIRELEMFLNKNYYNTENHGIIELKNEMMIPDYNYLLYVILRNSEGRIEEKRFNITYSDERNITSTTILGRLVLHCGSSFVYSSVPAIVNANVTLCGNASYYFFTWLVVTSKNRDVLPERSSMLTLSSKILKRTDERSFIIECLVIAFNDNKTLAKGSIQIDVKDPPMNLENKFNVILPFKYTTINKGAPIFITPYIYNPLMAATEFKIEWLCMLQNSSVSDCQGQINKEFYLGTGFNQEGNYSVTLKVTRGRLENSATCYVIIGKDIPSVELDTVLPVRPDQGIEIKAKIRELRTYCSVQWSSEKEHYIELSNIPGFHNEIYNISSKDKTFLEEIEEFGNITVTKILKIKIPPPSRVWKGLDGNYYNIKIVISCPTLTEVNDIHSFHETPEHFITLSAKTEFYVPPSPSLRSLEVFSTDGNNESLKSDYFFKVHPIDDGNDVNGPMIYQYGFIFDNLELLFYSGIDEFTAKTIMPYKAEYGVETFVKVCDYQNRCGKTFGPIIKTNQPVLNDNLTYKTFKQMLIEEDYYKAFSYTFIVLNSLSSPEQIKKYRTIFSAEIAEKIKFLMKEDNANRKRELDKLLNSLGMLVDHLMSKEIIEVNVIK